MGGGGKPSVETQVRTPQMVFMQPQRLVVPLFQRPYVWNEENQWEPLWNDVVRVADRLLAGPTDNHHRRSAAADNLAAVAGRSSRRTALGRGIAPSDENRAANHECGTFLLEARGPLQSLAYKPGSSSVQCSHGCQASRRP